MSHNSEKKIDLTKVEAVTHTINANHGVLVLINPQFADLAGEVEDNIKELVGHDNVKVTVAPADAIKIYQVEPTYTFGVDESVLKQLDPEDETPTYRLENWSLLREAAFARTRFRGNVYGHPLFVDGAVHHTPELSHSQLSTPPHKGNSYLFGAADDIAVYTLGNPA